MEQPHQSDVPPLAPFLDELIAEFLSWLSIKTSMQLKCISKSWNNLISNPSFIQKYLTKSSQNPHFTVMWRETIIIESALHSNVERNYLWLRCLTQPLHPVNQNLTYHPRQREFQLHEILLSYCWFLQRIDLLPFQICQGYSNRLKSELLVLYLFWVMRGSKDHHIGLSTLTLNELDTIY